MIAGAEPLTVARIVTGALRENCYVVTGPAGEALVVDPGDDAERIAAHLAEREARPIGVLLTHGHDDHVAAAKPIADLGGACVHMHGDDATVLRRANLLRTLGRGEAPIPIPSVDVDLAGSRSLRCGDLEVGVVHTPGHTPGSVCFEIGGRLFTGDTVLFEQATRTDLPGGDHVALAASLELLATRFPPDMPIHPGHGGPAQLEEALLRASSGLDR